MFDKRVSRTPFFSVGLVGGSGSGGGVWCVILVVLVLVCNANVDKAAKSYTIESYPDPKKDYLECGRKVPSWVCDPDQIVTTATADRLDEIIDRIHQTIKQGSCEQGGTQIVVALMNKFLLSSSGTTKQEEARRLAKGLHDNWGVGYAGCNNGIVFLLSKDDREIYISTGSGINHLLTDTQVHLVIEKMKPGLRASLFSETILDAIKDIQNIVLHDKPLESSTYSLDILLIILLTCACTLVCKCCIGGTNSYKQCRHRLSLIERQAKSRKLDASSCPICLDEFKTGHPQRPTEILDCGHRFCRSCIEGWFQTQRRYHCPICRQGHEEEQRKVEEAEVSFRLASLHRLHPDIVTIDMTDRWLTDRRWDLVSSFDSTISSRSSGSSGSSGSSSWGGGSSGGGGGGGGSW